MTKICGPASGLDPFPTAASAEDVPSHAVAGAGEVHTASVEGDTISYRIVGSGPSLLLLHGFSGSGTWWDSMIPELSQNHTLIIPDLPGHGDSSSRMQAYSYPHVAAQLFAMLDQLGVQPARAIGYSAGGTILLRMALQQPGRLQSMVLISAVHRTTESIRATVRGWQDYDAMPIEVRDYWQQAHPGGKRQMRALLAWLREMSDVPGNLDLGPGDLARVQARTLIVIGDSDELVPLELAEEMHRSIPESALWVVPMHGHPVLWPDWGGSVAARQQFPTILESFLGQGDPQAP